MLLIEPCMHSLNLIFAVYSNVSGKHVVHLIIHPHHFVCVSLSFRFILISSAL